MSEIQESTAVGSRSRSFLRAKFSRSAMMVAERSVLRSMRSSGARRRVLARGLLAHEFHRVADRGQRIAQLVAHGRGDLADGGQTLCGRQLLHRAMQVAVGFPQLRLDLAALDQFALELGGEAAIDERRGDAQAEDGDAGGGDCEGEAVGRDPRTGGHHVVGKRREDGRGHAGIVHAADGGAHHERGGHLVPGGLEIEGQPERRRRRHHGDDDRRREQQRVIADGGVHLHRRHAHVVHGRDADAGEHAGNEDALPTRVPAGDDIKGRAGHENRRHQ
jgi:hypothetical protein